MINPKQSLTPLSSIYLATSAQRPARAVVPQFAATLASANAVLDTEEAPLMALQDSYSISTVEELAALAHLDSKQKTSFFKELGLPAALARRLLKTFRGSDHGKEQIQEWERYQEFQLELGCDLDFDSPPPVEAPGTLSAPGGGAPVTAVNLIADCMPPIRHQHSRGTCVAFTTVAALEYYFCKFRAQPGLDLSEQFQFWNMVSHSHQRSLKTGFPLLQNSGVCRETTWPYNPTPRPAPDPDDQGPPPAQAVPEAKAFQCQTVRQLSPRSIADLQQALQRWRIVGIGIPVYNSWYNNGVVRLYGNITVPFPGEVPLPIGHAVALVGYADDAQYAGGGYFIVRNSWGNVWATQSVFGPGYGTIPYRYITNFNWDAWCIVA